jgi:hypothetical protein
VINKIQSLKLLRNQLEVTLDSLLRFYDPERLVPKCYLCQDNAIKECLGNVKVVPLVSPEHDLTYDYRVILSSRINRVFATGRDPVFIINGKYSKVELGLCAEASLNSFFTNFNGSHAKHRQ